MWSAAKRPSLIGSIGTEATVAISPNPTSGWRIAVRKAGVSDALLATEALPVLAGAALLASPEGAGEVGDIPEAQGIGDLADIQAARRQTFAG